MSKGESPDQTAKLPSLALIAGPTASGKSDLAITLAQALKQRGRRGVIINCDSAQVYADLSILSARPSAPDMQGVEHRLFGTWDGAIACSAADWAQQAKHEIAQVQQSGGTPILVGGTGLYMRTLLDGIAPIPPIAPDIRAQIRALPTDQAYQQLAAADPERAAMLNRADTTRICRALEVVHSTGKPLSHWHAQPEGGIAGQIRLHPLILLPERQWLYERCNARFAQMVERGAAEEVKTLLARKLDPALPVMRAIGVPELAGFLQGDWSMAVALERAAQATRNYAKRQYTWFRRQSPAQWNRALAQDINITDQFEILLRD